MTIIKCYCLKGRSGMHCPLTTNREDLEKTFNYQVRGEEIIEVEIDDSFDCQDEQTSSCINCPFVKNNIKHKEYNNIQKVLKEKGISQRALAKKMGRYKGTVSIWCRNERQPTLKALFEMAEILGVNIVELINTEQK